MPLRSALAISLASCLLTTAAQAAMTQEELNRVVGAFYSSTVVDEGNAYEVRNLTITKDIGTFTLKQGTLYLTKPIEGMIATAVFIGDGTATIKPIRPMDQDSLDIAAEQHLGKKPGGQIATPFTQLVLVSFDGTLDTLPGSLQTRNPSPNVAEASRVLKDRMDVMSNLELPFDLQLLGKVSGVTGGALYVDFKSRDFDWLEYLYSDLEQYEVNLFALVKVGAFFEPRPLIHSHRKGDFDGAGHYIADAVKDQKDWIDVKGYKMVVTIPNKEHFTVDGSVTFTPVQDGLNIVYFDLRNNIPPPMYYVRSNEKGLPIQLTKLTDTAGHELPFVHLKHHIYIVPPEPLRVGTEYSYLFSLDERTIIQHSSAHFEVLNTYPWFPQHGYVGGRYAMDWTIKTAKPLVATGSGRLIPEPPEAGFNVAHMIFRSAVEFPSIIFGEFQSVIDKYVPAQGDAVDMSVFYAPRAAYQITDPDLIRALLVRDFGRPTRPDAPIDYYLTVPPAKPRDVITEGKGVIKFCEELYGPFPFDSLNVAQMEPFKGFGQSPPGFVQLTGEAFMAPNAVVDAGDYKLDFSVLKLDYFHEFFSHEIAHQWWAHTVSWASDEDVWLSESFAEYTAGLYVMQYLGLDRFQGKLKEWRDSARIADPHAPIAWAGSVSGPNAGEWRTGLLYAKGPYVVHMLRMQIGHDNFVKAMRNVTSKYRFQEITTDQLMHEVEAVVGYKLDYFFDQWYRRTGIPMFDYTTDVRQGEDGKWLATIKFSQRDKQNYKIVAMPVFFHFGGDKVVVRTPAITKADDVYQVKLPEKPQSITLDDYHTLLADFVAQQGAAGQ